MIKKGFVTPRTTFGLEREKKGGKEARRGGGRVKLTITVWKWEKVAVGKGGQDPSRFS